MISMMMAQMAINASMTPPTYNRDSPLRPPLLMLENKVKANKAATRTAMIGSSITHILHRAAVRSLLAPFWAFALKAGLIISTPKAFFIMKYATRVATHIASVMSKPTPGIFSKIPKSTVATKQQISMITALRTFWILNAVTLLLCIAANCVSPIR